MTRSAELLLMGSDELEGHLEESRRELFNLRFQLATGQLDNTSRLGEVRREVARVLTLLREREIAEAEALDAAARRQEGPLFEPAARQRRARVAEASGETDDADRDAEAEDDVVEEDEDDDSGEEPDEGGRA